MILFQSSVPSLHKMNFTVLALSSALSTSASPLFSGLKNFKCEKSMFSRHFSSILWTSERFSFRKTSFSKVLESAIVLDSGSVALNRKLFKSTEKIKDTECSIVQCNFHECSSSGTGGALVFDCGGACEFSILISKTGFSKCEASKAGAFQVNAGKAMIYESCFSECKAKENFPNFKISGKEASIENIYVESSKGPHGIGVDCASSLKYASANHSRNVNDENSFLSLICDGSTFTCTYMAFESNRISGVLFYIKGPNVVPQFLNFHNDQCSSIIEAGSGMQIWNSFFINEQCKNYIVANGKSVTLRDSAWSGSESQASSAFTSINIFAGELKNDVKEVGRMEIKSSAECWLLIPANTTVIGSSNAIRWVIALAILILFVGLLCFFFCKRNKYGLSTDRLAYTL